MGLAKGLAAAGDDDMGTNSGACTLNLNGVDGADTTATTGLIAAAAAAVVSAAPSSSWWWEILVVVVAHCCLSLLLISCAMIDGGGEPIGRSACRGRGSRLYIYNIYTRAAGSPDGRRHHTTRCDCDCDATTRAE
jgi:hypothetical protein